MPIDANELVNALNTLVTQNPTAFAGILGKALNLDAKALAGIVEVGAQAKLRDQAKALLDEVRAISAALLGAERDAIEAMRRKEIAPLEQALAERTGRHAGVISRIEAMAAEIEAGRKVDLPKFEALKAELEG